MARRRAGGRAAVARPIAAASEQCHSPMAAHHGGSVSGDSVGRARCARPSGWRLNMGGGGGGDSAWKAAAKVNGRWRRPEAERRRRWRQPGQEAATCRI